MGDLREFELFKNFSDDSLQAVSNLITEKDYEENEAIFMEGEPGNALYFVAEGEVAIRRLIDPWGSRQKTIAIIEKGDFFGEMVIFDDKPRSASAFASTRSKILTLKKNDFWKLICEEPKTAIAKLLEMNRVMSERLRVANQNFITTYEIGQIMATVTNLEDLFELTLEQLVSAIEKSDASFGALYDEFSEEFMILSKKGKAVEKVRGSDLSKEDSIVKEFLLGRRWIYIEKPEDREQYPDLFSKICDGKSLIISPMVRDEKLLGILFVVSFEEYRAFSQANKLLVGTVAGQIGAAIENLKYKEEEENRERLQKKRYSY
jgi:CRP-like cAMP-binding protein